MKIQEVLQQMTELQKVLRQADKIAEKMQNEMPDMEEPAMSAQCSVIRAFLYQVELQEEVLSSMLKSKNNPNGHLAA